MIGWTARSISCTAGNTPAAACGSRDTKDRDRHGSGESVLAIPDWLKDVRELFPRETVEVLERHALERYGMTELVTDADVLQKMEPSYELLEGRALVSPPDGARRCWTWRGRSSARWSKSCGRRLAREVRQVLWGRLNRQRRSPLKVARNLDWHRTIRANLKHYDRDRKRLILQSLSFFSRVEHHMPWHIIMAVDCSGSMMDSVIHSAVMAGIFKGLPAVRVSLVAFDTAVVDLTEQADDPTEVLMSVQLGGGTDIAGALGYCETPGPSPRRTIVVLVTDFFEGGPPGALPGAIKRLREAGVRVLGLAALDAEANPTYDRQMAERCVAAGAEVAALTPRRLAEWMARVLSCPPPRGALAAFDDDALAALSSKGLVRRARKDLETIRPKISIRPATRSRLPVEVGDAVVELAMPPAHRAAAARPSGICRHILAALIFVRRPETTNGGGLRRTGRGRCRTAELARRRRRCWPSMTGRSPGGRARRWSSRASKALALGLPVEFEEGDQVAARLPTRNVTCRWMPGCGPEGMVCSCHARGGLRAPGGRGAGLPGRAGRGCWMIPSSRLARGRGRRPTVARRGPGLGGSGGLRDGRRWASRGSRGPRPSGSGRSPSRPTESTCPGSSGCFAAWPPRWSWPWRATPRPIRPACWRRPRGWRRCGTGSAAARAAPGRPAQDDLPAGGRHRAGRHRRAAWRSASGTRG